MRTEALAVDDLRCRIYIPFGNESEKSAQTVPPFLSGKHIRSTTLPPRSYKFASTHGEVVSYLKLKDPLQGFSDSRVTFMQPDHWDQPGLIKPGEPGRATAFQLWEYWKAAEGDSRYMMPETFMGHESFQPKEKIRSPNWEYRERESCCALNWNQEELLCRRDFRKNRGRR